ncbi:MAG TPA: hypothetical protein VF121_03045 [Thermoanaerobaculia bacterium]|nr:hypothetical protein [Thermoanaerobaculia bacterium]
MSDPYDAARARRNPLERLGEKIPGFRGFQDRELRRDVDRLQREHLAGELSHIKGALRERARAATDRGRLGALGVYERLDRQLDGLAQSVRFSDYGAAGFFDPVKIGEPELAKLYAFDLALVEEIAALETEVAALPAAADEASEGLLARLEERVRALADRWRDRETVISDVVRVDRGKP